MKYSTKLTSIILSLIMLLTMVPVPAFAEELSSNEAAADGIAAEDAMTADGTASGDVTDGEVGETSANAESDAEAETECLDEDSDDSEAGCEELIFSEGTDPDAIKNADPEQLMEEFLFSTIDFAVMSKPGNTYNFDHFYRNFGNYYVTQAASEEKKRQHPELIAFWHEYDDYGFLSNWYHADFIYAGKKYSSVEQFMMYHKLLTFDQFGLAEKVMETDDPAEAKKIGRTKLSNFDDKLWTRISAEIVKRAVRAKFDQNPQLRDELLSTGNAVLVECSPYDQIWGIGLAPGDERIYDTGKWRGKNKLGRILMNVREEFLRSTDKSSLPECLDVRKAEMIPEFKMSVGMLKMIPQYYDAIDAYSARVDPRGIKAFYSGSLEGWHNAMMFNMGGGLDIIGFYEMMQEET